MDRVRRFLEEIEQSVETQRVEWEREQDRLRQLEVGPPRLTVPEPRLDEPTEPVTRDEIPAERPTTPRRHVVRTPRQVLRTRDGLRQALVLAEIIGPPKALREPDTDW